MNVITRIVIENFKSLRKVDLTLGRMNLFIGTNASGKSNFLDALRVLEGIGNGLTIDEILDGKPRSSTSEAWKGIRGGSVHTCLAGVERTDEITISVHGTFEKPPSLNWKYEIIFSPGGEGKVIRENINTGKSEYSCGRITQPAAQVETRLDQIRDFPKIPRPPYPAPILASYVDVDLADAKNAVYINATKNRLATLFSNAQHFDPDIGILRSYSESKYARRMGNQGEDFAALIRTICQDDDLKDAYLSWLRGFRPEEVSDVGTMSGAVDEPMFMLRENGRKFPAPVLSDGTLRFAAIAAAFFQPDMPDVMTIEEIENGIHASRVQLLLELLRNQTELTKTQIVATTHSATILDWCQENDYETTFLCTRDEASGESRIRPLTEVPYFMEAIGKRSVSELFSEGWMEVAP